MTIYGAVDDAPMRVEYKNETSHGGHQGHEVHEASNTPHLEQNTYIVGLAEDCRNSSALAMELLESLTKPSIC